MEYDDDEDEKFLQHLILSSGKKVSSLLEFEATDKFYLKEPQSATFLSKDRSLIDQRPVYQNSNNQSDN